MEEGKVVDITKENLEDFVGKTVKILPPSISAVAEMSSEPETDAKNPPSNPDLAQGTR